MAAGGLLAVSLVERASPPQSTAARNIEIRAVAFLSREVPRWRAEHPCYSCHNNGDAARALLAAWRRGHDVGTALTDTLAWLSHPIRWETNAGGEGGGDDKRLARIQFAAATAAAAADARVRADALNEAAAIVAADQQADGSWRLDASDSIGSPATYGTALATAFARRTLLRSRLEKYAPAITRAGAWLRSLPVSNVPDAGGVLLGLEDDAGVAADEPRQQALAFLARTQGPDGGWGPYATSPAEPFDTALAVIALSSAAGRPASTAPAFTPASLRSSITRGRGYLHREQLDDGSWMETTRPARQQSYAQRISTTAWALLALFEGPAPDR
jgi:squalene cyclase